MKFFLIFFPQMSKSCFIDIRRSLCSHCSTLIMYARAIKAHFINSFFFYVNKLLLLLYFKLASMPHTFVSSIQFVSCTDFNPLNCSLILSFLQHFFLPQFFHSNILKIFFFNHSPKCKNIFFGSFLSFECFHFSPVFLFSTAIISS